MASFYVPQESAPVYTLRAPNGDLAVINDPTSPYYVSSLNGEEAITGIDSPEIRDSFYELVEAEGSIAGNSFATRRPIVMNGLLVPTSVQDRADRLGRLQAVINGARFADGTLEWTPSSTGAEPVFLYYRMQLPLRSKGTFNKEWMAGLVANDPRIYSRKVSTALFPASSGDPAFERFAWASGSNTTIATRNLYIPPGTWTVKMWARMSFAGTRGMAFTLGGGTPTGSGVNMIQGTTWTLLERTFTTTNAEGTASALTFALSSALTGSGQYVETGPVVLESADGQFPSGGATLSSNWAAGTGYTRSIQTSNPPPGIENQGNALARPRVRVNGSATNAIIGLGDGGLVQFGNAGFSSTTVLTADYVNTTLYNVFLNAYSWVMPANTTWGGLTPGNSLPVYWVVSGGHANNRMEVVWRSTWL